MAKPPAKVDTRTKRIMKELKEIEQDPPGNCSAGMVGDDINVWEATIIGPTNSPYSRGIFRLAVELPDEYPFKPPKITFITKVYHPNIDENGNICLNTLKTAWSPALTMASVLLSVCSLLTDPNPQDPLVPEIAAEYMKNRPYFNIKARSWTDTYAT